MFAISLTKVDDVAIKNLIRIMVEESKNSILTKEELT